MAIIDVEPEHVALLEEALGAVGEQDLGLSSQLRARLAVELNYRRRATAARRSAPRPCASPARRATRARWRRLNARHVALWRPDRLDERLRTADEMIAAARTAGAPDLELQARNWRVVDLFEAGDLTAWRAEVRRHGALAHELRLPAFAWYTPLWAAVDALHAGRFAEGRALAAEACAAGERAGDPNAGLFSVMLGYQERVMRADYGSIDLEYGLEKVAASPAGVSWRCGVAWALAGLGRVDEAREHLAIVAADGYAHLPFDMNWASGVVECAETCVLLGDATSAEPLYDLIAPYAGRWATAGRAMATYGAVDRYLGGLAALLGRLDDAVAHFKRAVALDTASGLRPWVAHARAGLADALERVGLLRPAAAEAARAAAEARELGLRLRAHVASAGGV